MVPLYSLVLHSSFARMIGWETFYAHWRPWRMRSEIAMVPVLLETNDIMPLYMHLPPSFAASKKYKKPSLPYLALR